MVAASIPQIIIAQSGRGVSKTVKDGMERLVDKRLIQEENEELVSEEDEDGGSKQKQRWKNWLGAKW